MKLEINEINTYLWYDAGKGIEMKAGKRQRYTCLNFAKTQALKVLKIEQHLCSLAAPFSVWFPTICPTFPRLFLCEWQMI